MLLPLSDHFDTHLCVELDYSSNVLRLERLIKAVSGGFRIPGAMVFPPHQLTRNLWAKITHTWETQPQKKDQVYPHGKTDV